MFFPNNSKRKKLYEGKAKIIYEGPEAGTVIQYFKDDASNGDKKAEFSGKGALNNAISSFLMMKLEELGVPTHFLKRLNMREQLVRQVEIVPIEVVVRNMAAGSFATRYGWEEGIPLPRPIVEFYYKKNDLGNPMMSEDHIMAFGLASIHELDEMIALALRINDYLSGLFLGVGLRLVDFKLEFGRVYVGENEVRIFLADEISPDNCRLWDTKTNEKLDKDRFRRDMGGVIEAYQEIARRLGVLPENGIQELIAEIKEPNKEPKRGMSVVGADKTPSAAPASTAPDAPIEIKS